MHLGIREGGTEREVHVPLVADDTLAFLYQTPEYQQLVTPTLKTFFPSAKQTYKFLCP